MPRQRSMGGRRGTLLNSGPEPRRRRAGRPRRSASVFLARRGALSLLSPLGFCLLAAARDARERRLEGRRVAPPHRAKAEMRRRLSGHPGGEGKGYPCGSGIAGAEGASLCSRPTEGRAARAAGLAATSVRGRGFSFEGKGRLGRERCPKSGALLSRSRLCVRNGGCSPLDALAVFDVGRLFPERCVHARPAIRPGIIRSICGFSVPLGEAWPRFRSLRGVYFTLTPPPPPPPPFFAAVGSFSFGRSSDFPRRVRKRGSRLSNGIFFA